MSVERIRIRYNGRNIELSKFGVENESGAFAICANTVASLLKTEVRRFAFKGFIEIMQGQTLLLSQRCKVIDIRAYYTGLSDFEVPQEIPRNSYCVGLYENSGIYLLKQDNLLIHYPLS